MRILCNVRVNILNRRLSMNRPFGVPALAGPGRLKAGLRTDRTIQTGSWYQCIRKNERGLSMIALRSRVRVASLLCEKRPANPAPAARGPDLARLRKKSRGRRDHARLAAQAW